MSCQYVVPLPKEPFLFFLLWKRDGSSNGRTAVVFLICNLCNLPVKEGACLLCEDFGVHCTIRYINNVLFLMINFYFMFEIEHRDTDKFSTYLNIV